MSRASALVVAAVVVIVSVGAAVRVERREDRCPVVFASRLIPQGTPADAIVAGNVPCDQLEPGAVDDPAEVRGAKVRRDVLPGQQLVETHFHAATGRLRTAGGTVYSEQAG